MHVHKGSHDMQYMYMDGHMTTSSCKFLYVRLYAYVCVCVCVRVCILCAYDVHVCMCIHYI